jgi:hypothetical protein
MDSDPRRRCDCAGGSHIRFQCRAVPASSRNLRIQFQGGEEGALILRARAANPFPWDPSHGEFVLALEAVPLDSVEARDGSGIFPVVADPVTNAETLKGGDGAAINGMRITRRPLGVPVFGRKWDLNFKAQWLNATPFMQRSSVCINLLQTLTATDIFNSTLKDRLTGRSLIVLAKASSSILKLQLNW